MVRSRGSGNHRGDRQALNRFRTMYLLCLATRGARIQSRRSGETVELRRGRRVDSTLGHSTSSLSIHCRGALANGIRLRSRIEALYTGGRGACQAKRSVTVARTHPTLAASQGHGLMASIGDRSRCLSDDRNRPARVARVDVYVARRSTLARRQKSRSHLARSTRLRPQDRFAVSPRILLLARPTRSAVTEPGLRVER